MEGVCQEITNGLSRWPPVAKLGGDLLERHRPRREPLILPSLQKRLGRLEVGRRGDHHVVRLVPRVSEPGQKRLRDPGGQKPRPGGQRVAVTRLGLEAHRALALPKLQPPGSPGIRHIQSVPGLPRDDGLALLGEDTLEQPRLHRPCAGIDEREAVEENERVDARVPQIREGQGVLAFQEQRRREARGEDVRELAVEGGLPQRCAVQGDAQMVLVQSLGVRGPLEDHLDLGLLRRGRIQPVQCEGEALAHPPNNEVPEPDVGGVQEPGLVEAVGLEARLVKRSQRELREFLQGPREPLHADTTGGPLQGVGGLGGEVHRRGHGSGVEEELASRPKVPGGLDVEGHRLSKEAQAERIQRDRLRERQRLEGDGVEARTERVQMCQDAGFARTLADRAWAAASSGASPCLLGAGPAIEGDLDLAASGRGGASGRWCRIGWGSSRGRASCSYR